MLKLIVWLAERVVPTNNVRVFRVGFSISIKSKIDVENRARRTNTATYRTHGRHKDIEVSGANCPNLCIA